LGGLRWLIHGNVTPAAVEALVRHGHTATPAEASFADAAELFKHLHQKQLDLITTDRDLADQSASASGRKFDRSIVYLQLAGGDVEQDDAIDRLFTRYKRLKPGMLYTVTESRVKVRQLPGL